MIALMIWTTSDVEIVFDEMTDEPVVMAEISPLGQLQIMAEVRREGRRLEFDRCHIQSSGPANVFGRGRWNC